MCPTLFLAVNAPLYHILFFSEFYYHTFNGKAPGPVTAGFIESVLIKHFHMDFTGSTGV